MVANMINVKFRVVGIYLGCFPGDPNSSTGQITVQVNDNPTVYDVMKAVALKVASGGFPGVELFGFNPSPASQGQEIQSISVEYSVKPRKNRPYAPGVYILEDSRGSNPNRVLQYYIMDANGVQKNRNNDTAVFTLPPDVPIVDGDTVLWRQVSICMGPNGGFRSTSLAKRSLERMKKS
jgi:hypothetical protein